MIPLYATFASPPFRCSEPTRLFCVSDFRVIFSFTVIVLLLCFVLFQCYWPALELFRPRWPSGSFFYVSFLGILVFLSHPSSILPSSVFLPQRKASPACSQNTPALKRGKLRHFASSSSHPRRTLYSCLSSVELCPQLLSLSPIGSLLDLFIIAIVCAPGIGLWLVFAVFSLA